MSEEVLQKLFEAALRELPPQEQEPAAHAASTHRPEPVRREEPVANEETLKKLFEAALREAPEKESNLISRKTTGMTVGA